MLYAAGNGGYDTGIFHVLCDFFLNAYAEYQAELSQLFVAQDMFDITDGRLIEVIGLIDDELKLIKAVMKSDKERYKALP